jgi:hypothetical protein
MSTAVHPTYRRSAARARGSAASDKPGRCNALLASVTVRASTQVEDDSGRSRRPEERVGRCDTPPRKETCVGAVGASRGGVASKIPSSPGSCRKGPVFPTERRPPPSNFARGTNVRHQVPPRQPRARSQAAGSPLTISSRHARKSSPDTAVTSPLPGVEPRTEFFRPRRLSSFVHRLSVKAREEFTRERSPR